LIGHTGIAICHGLVGILTIYKVNYGVLGFMCLFIVVYEFTSGPLAWIYAAETCNDVSLGICTYTLYLTVFFLSLVTEPLMDSVIQPQGVFFMFGLFSACAVVFIYFNIKETMGLSDKEKKTLYAPKDL